MTQTIELGRMLEPLGQEGSKPSPHWSVVVFKSSDYNMAEEIKLAADTLRWLHGLRDEELPEHVRPRMRDLVANICDFQFGFSLPLDLGMNSNSRLAETLPIDRPIESLIRWKVAFEVQPSEVESFEVSDHEKVGERVFCLVGGPTWESQVASGKIEGEGAEEPSLDASDWMLDLFDVLDSAAKLDAKRKAGARRLAACWYNVAMVVSFEKVEEEDGAPLSMDDIMAMMMGGMSLGGMGDYDEEDAEDIDEDGDAPAAAAAAKRPSLMASLMRGEIADDDDESDEYDPAKDPNDDGLDVETTEDPDDEDEVAAAASSSKEPAQDHATRRRQLAAALMAGQLEDDDDDDEYDPEKDSNDDGEDIDISDEEDDGSLVIVNEDGKADDEEGEEAEEEEDEETRKQRAEEFRVRVLGVIDKLGAQWPHIEDQSWLKRMLKLMSIADEEEKQWFPWGLPALEPLQKGAESSDDLEKYHALSILSLYQQRQDATSSSIAH